MQAAKRWKEWETFEPAARQVLSGFHKHHHRAPTILELGKLGQRWISNAAMVHHGGYCAVLNRLGYPTKNGRRLTTNRSDWRQFVQDVQPIIATEYARLGRLPTQQELRQRKLHWVLAAAYYHHGGMIKVYARLGYNITGLRCRWSWSEFEAAAKPELESAIRQFGRTPFWHELKADPQRCWILNACQKKFGGYRQVLKRFGLPLTTKPCPQRGTGLANWEQYQREVRPIIQQYFERYGRAPYVPELRRMGHHRYVSAARNHHGGYLAALLRMDFQLNQKQTQRRQRGWKSRSVQLTELRRHFPELLSLGVMPSSCQVIAVLGGLYTHWVRQGHHWSEIAVSFGLMDSRPGKTRVLYIRSVQEALSFFERERRWPNSTEAGPTLRRLRWQRRTTWERFLMQTDLTRLMLETLANRWREHVHWCQRHYPEMQRPHTRIMNRIIIARNENPAPPHST